MLTVYKASAGSGKTYTLTFEYIKLLLGYKREDGKYALHSAGKEHHRSILAITFTNKATAEMKQRIVKELAVLAGAVKNKDAKSPYQADLLKLYRCSEPELRESAYRALNELLFDYSFFNISTIDAFFQNVLRVFAREAELAGNYEVELSDEFAVMNGVSDVLASLNHCEMSTRSSASEDDKRRRRLSEWLKRYMLNRISESDTGFNMFSRTSPLYSAIVSFVKEISKDDFKVDSNRILEYLKDDARVVAFEQSVSMAYIKLRNQLVRKAQLVIETLESAGLTVMDCLATSTRGALAKWAAGEESAFSASFSKIIDNLDDPKPRYLAKFKGELPAGLDERYVDAIVSIHENYPCLNLYKMTRNNVYMLGLLSGVLAQIDNYRQENNLILLSDTNEILQRIICEDELPFIYERVGTTLKHFLIDEFQDTSRMQWGNLQPLVRESMSHGHDNLIIGDEKQCIYRFRDSDPSLLQYKVQAEYAGDDVVVRGNNVSANTNWRSSADVVRFNNTIFMAMADVLGAGDLYANVVQQIAGKRRNQPGYVKFTALKDDFDEVSLPILAQEIRRQIESGYKQSDIAILVRDAKDGRKAIDYLLDYAKRNEGYPHLNILSDGALVVGNSAAVKLIVSVMRIIDAADNERDARAVNMREIGRIATCFERCISRGETPSQALVTALKSRASLDDEKVEICETECLSLPSIVERIVSRFLSKETCQNENIYITAFQDVVVDYCSHGTGDLRTFLRWWDASGRWTNLAFPDSMDAIKVITIHKSKGLEFKCVHIPFAKWPMSKDEDIKWFDTKGVYDEFPSDIVPPAIPIVSNSKLNGTPFESQYEQHHRAEVLDQLNVTYVAFTRAVDELIVNYEASDNINKVGGLITKAIGLAGKAYCDTASIEKGGDLPAECRDFFVPLKDSFNNGVLQIGNPTVCSVTDSVEDEVVEVRKAVAYTTADRDDMWNLSRIENIEDLTKPRTRGIILHDILQQVKHSDDVEIAVRRRAYRLGLSAGETQEITDYLVNALADERVRQWFEGYKSIVRERPIVERDGRRTRPDRIVWTADDTVDVVDYKFGKRTAAGAYDKQVRGYMQSLVDMGYSNVRGFVWYLETGEIDEVTI